MRTRLLALLVSLIAALGSVSAVIAESYPEHPIRIIVSYPPTGSTDLLARLIAPHLSQTWGVPVVVENKPGASGNIGMEMVARSAPDGLTLAMTNNVSAINVNLFPDLPFDIVKDFEPLGLIGSTPMVVAVNPKFPPKTVAELTEYARKNPGRVAYASCGIGTPQQLAIELYRSLTKTKMLHVPYKGCAPGVTDLIGGQVELMAMTASQAAPQIKSGNLRALAVTTSHRSAVLPEVPTFAEAGVPGYELDIWFGLMAPAGTPAPVLDKIHDEVKDFITLTETRAKLVGAGVEELVTSRAEHARVLKQDLEKYAKLISDLNLKPGQ